jgi:hypothetical protein
MRFTPKADMCGATTDVCYGPIATWLICNRRLQWAANADGWAIGSAVKAISPLDTITIGVVAIAGDWTSVGYFFTGRRLQPGGPYSLKVIQAARRQLCGHIVVVGD